MPLFDQLTTRLKLDLALIEDRLCLRDLRFARIVRQHGDNLVLLHVLPALHAHFGEHAAGARRDRYFLVGFGSAGQGELARMRRNIGVEHGHAKRLRLVVDRANGGAALRCLVRKQMPRRNPADGCDHKADSNKTATLHDFLPDLARAVLTAIEQHVFGDIEKHRQHSLGVEMSDRPRAATTRHRQ